MSRYLADRMSGPLAPFAHGLSIELRERGLGADTVWFRMRLLTELNSWMVVRGLGLSDLNAAVVEELLASARAAGVGIRKWAAPASERDVLVYLRGLGLVEPPVAPALTAVKRLVDRFVEYLVRERGLEVGSTSVYWYARIASSFLAARVDPDSGTLEPLSAGDVSRFMLSECRRCSRWTGKRLVTCLRGLLRFLLVEGLVAEDLVGAVPRVPAWSLVALPKPLPAGDGVRIVASVDRSTAIGRRDFAILMLLWRMALRGCEVARLRLGDLDWHTGELIVRGKRDYHERLPLPVDVGEALVDYLRHGRPETTDRHVFVSAKRPFVSLTGGDGTIGRIVRQASERAGLAPVGVHRLRHTVATDALRAGASLEEIASLLRHREYVTTMGYAKVDWERLRELARPWPAGGRS